MAPAGPPIAGQIRADAFPHHDGASCRIETGLAQPLFEIIGLEIDGDKRHPIQIGAGRLQPLAFYLSCCGMIDFKNLDGIKRGEPPRPRIKTRAEQHDLFGLCDRFPDPVVDQPRASDAGSSRARPLPVNVARQHGAHRTHREQSRRKPEASRQQRYGQWIGEHASCGTFRMFGRAEHGHVFGGPARPMLQHLRDLHKKNIYSF